MAKVVKVDAAEFAKRWGAGLKGSVERIRDGVNATTVAPGVAAAKSADKWHAAMMETKTKDKWARRVAEVSLPDWQQAMLNKGINRIAVGVDEAQPKMAIYGEKLIAHQNGLLQQLDTMADLTLEDSIARMTSWVRGMAKLTV